MSKDNEENRKLKEKYKLAIDNISKVIDYLNEKYPFKIDWNPFFYYNLEIYSQEYEEVKDKDKLKEDYEVTFGIELHGQEDGTLIAYPFVWRESYYPQEVQDKDFGRYIYSYELYALNRVLRKGNEFISELQEKFDFIKSEYN